VLRFTITSGKIVDVDIIADPVRLGALHLTTLSD
jgi:hypothetical protein